MSKSDAARYFSAGVFLSYASSEQELSGNPTPKDLENFLAAYRRDYVLAGAPPDVLQNFDDMAAGIEGANVWKDSRKWSPEEKASWAKNKPDQEKIDAWLRSADETPASYYFVLGTSAMNVGYLFGELHSKYGYSVSALYPSIAARLGSFVDLRDKEPVNFATLSPDGQAAIRELAALDESTSKSNGITDEQFKRMVELGEALYDANGRFALIVKPGPALTATAPSSESSWSNDSTAASETPAKDDSWIYFSAGCFYSYASSPPILSLAGNSQKLKEMFDVYRNDLVSLSAPPNVLQNFDDMVAHINASNVFTPLSQWTKSDSDAWAKVQSDDAGIRNWLGSNTVRYYYFGLGTSATDVGPVFGQLHSSFGWRISDFQNLSASLKNFVGYRDWFPAAFASLSPNGQRDIRELAALSERSQGRNLTEQEFKRMVALGYDLFNANANHKLILSTGLSLDSTPTASSSAVAPAESSSPASGAPQSVEAQSSSPTGMQSPVGAAVNVFNAGAMMEILLNPHYLAGMKINGGLDQQLDRGRSLLQSAQAPDEVMSDYGRASQVILSLPFDLPPQQWSPAQKEQFRNAHLDPNILRSWLGTRTSNDFYYYLGTSCAYLGHVVPDDINLFHVADASLQNGIAASLKDFVRLRQNSPDAVQTLAPAVRSTFLSLADEAQSCFQAHRPPPPQLLHEMEQQAASIFKAGDSYQLTR